MIRSWMPLYVGDYLADTRRLSTLEHGAYLLLIMDYWQNGSLPDDDSALARIAGLNAREWAVARKAISPLFMDGWKHKRIEAEIKRANDKSQSARESSAHRWKSERNANASSNAMRTHSEGTCEQDAHARVPQSQLDSSLRSESNATPRRVEKSETPKSILLEVLSPETADGVIEHRRKKRAPLTVMAAQELAKGFKSTADPEDAARTMVARGWQGFKREWYEEHKSDGRSGNADRRGKPSLAELERSFVARLKPGPDDRGSLALPSRGGGEEGEDPDRLLSARGTG